MHFNRILKVTNMRAHYRTVTQLISDIGKVFGETDKNYAFTTVNIFLT